MADHAKLWTDAFLDEDGAPYAGCYAQFFDVTGSTRKAVWTNRDKTLPTAGGTLADVEGDDFGRITAYGDGVYQIVVRQSGDPGSNVPIVTFEGVQLVDASPAYDGANANFSLEELEERLLAGAGRQALSSTAQTDATLNLGGTYFASQGKTYLVPGATSLVTYDKVATGGHEDGARITIECISNPFKLRAKRDGEATADYNLEIGTDFVLSVGSSIDMELRSGNWYERARNFYVQSYENAQTPGVGASASIVASGPVMYVTGSATIRNVYWIVSGQQAPPGTVLTLHFETGATVEDNMGNLDMDDDFVGQSGATLSLVATGTGWLEKGRTGEVAVSSITQALGSGATPSVAGSTSTYYTGDNYDTVSRLTSPGSPGRIITLIFNGTEEPLETYTNVRKTISHEGSASEGYVSLANGVDFGTVPGDTLTLQCFVDASSVKYWGEIGRTMASVVPKITLSSGVLTVWRTAHVLEVTSGSTDITSIMPEASGPWEVTIFYGGIGSATYTFKKNEGNYLTEPGNSEVNELTEVVMIHAITGAYAASGKRWLAHYFTGG